MKNRYKTKKQLINEIANISYEIRTPVNGILGFVELLKAPDLTRKEKKKYIRMPDMDGYEATREIRKFNKNVVIIAQTAFGLRGDRATAIEAGCNDHISKPINKDQLVGLIKKHLYLT